MTFQRLLLLLVSGLVILPMAALLLLGVGRLLGAMGDASGAAVLDRLALAGGLCWTLDLVALVLVLGMRALGPPEDDSSGEG